MWQLRARRLHLVFLLTSACLIVGGSLAPFSWHAVALDEAFTTFGELWSNPPARLSRIDVAVNVLLTVPLAYAMLGTCQLSYVGRAPLRVLTVLTLICCAALTLAVEFAQLFIGPRVPSSSDVHAQIAGALIGVTLWRVWGLDLTRLLIAPDRGESGGSGWVRALSLYTIGMIIYSVLPLDLTVSPAEVYQKWKAGGIQIVPFQKGESGWFRWLVTLVMEAALWVPVGMWLATRQASVRRRLTGIAILAIGLECAQVFVQSRVADITDVLVGMVGAALGLRLASRWLPTESFRPAVSGASGSGRWYGAALGLGALIVLAFTFPYDFQLSPAFIKQNLLALGRAPLEAGLSGSWTSMLFDGLRTAVVFGLLGVVSATALAHSRLASVAGLVPASAAVYAGSVASVIEVAKLALPNRVNDITDVILAMCFAGAAAAFSLPIAKAARPVRPPAENAERTAPVAPHPTVPVAEASPRGLTGEVDASDRIPALDGLRALAAAGVFAVHWQQLASLDFPDLRGFSLTRLLENGNTGVALFFVLSGFLLSVPLWQALGEGRRFSYGAYAVRRVARIIPAYYGCLFGLLVLLALRGEFPDFGDVVAHLMLVHHWSDAYFYSINAPFWTIGVEVQFYVALALAFGMLKLLRVAAPTALGVVLASIVVSFLTQYVLSAGGAVPGTCDLDHAPSLSRSLTAHLPIFLTGVILGHLWLRHPPRHQGFLHDALILGAISVCVGVLSTPWDDTLTICGTRYNFPFVTIPLAVLVYSAPRSRLGRLLLDSRVMVYLGGISYGFYLFHLPVQKAVKSGFKLMSLPAAEHWLAFGIVSLCLAIAVSAASHRWLEQPVLSAARKRFVLQPDR